MPRLEEVTSALEAIEAGATPQDLESTTLDFKEQAKSDGDTLKLIADAALCFANSSGGVVVVGVADRVSGLAAIRGTTLAADAVRKRVYELSRPPLTVDAWEEEVLGKRLLFVAVPQSPEIHSDPQGRAPRRIGKDCLPMDPSEQMRLREDRLGIDWSSKESALGPSDLSAAALDQARTLLSKFGDERRRLQRLGDAELLRALGVLGDKNRVLNAGAVLFGPPTKGAPIVYQFQATPGGEPKAIERLEQPLVLAFQQAMGLIQARRSVTPLNLPDGQQIQIEDLPSLAAREALANAVIHRDYHLRAPVNIVHSPDLLVVTSPGPLVAGVTPGNILTHPSKPRNPCLMNAARVLGLAEEIGRGVDRMYREMISAGRDIPRIESSHDLVRVGLAGGRANTQIARFVAQLPEQERDDTDAMLVLFRLCSVRTVTAEGIAPVLQKNAAEAETALRRLASDAIGILEPTRQSARRAHPTYRLRGEVLKALGTAVPYQRRTVDEIDRKVVAHVQEYGKVTNRTVQNLLDVGINRARDILAHMVERKILRKTSAHERGPGVEYGPGARYPAPRKRNPRASGLEQPQLELGATTPRRRRR
jgi:ATP-dependent DNA helicase RecG